MPTWQRLCEVARRLLDADGAAITLRSSQDPRMLVAATDNLAARLQDAQDVTGQGPSVDAQADCRVVTAGFGDSGDGRWSRLHEQARGMDAVDTVVAVPWVTVTRSES